MEKCLGQSNKSVSMEQVCLSGTSLLQWKKVCLNETSLINGATLSKWKQVCPNTTK